MTESLNLPVTDPREVERLLDGFPVAVDRSHFVQFVLGFPRKYLINTPRLDLVKHYFLHRTLGERAVITSLYRTGGVWKLHLIARDRSFLFSRIAGTLSYFGMNITSAEAFANASSVVLDTFEFLDRENFFDRDQHRHLFQQFLEDVLGGNRQLEPLLRQRLEQAHYLEWEPFSLDWDDLEHPTSTRLRIQCEDHFCLLYLISRCISEIGCNIEMAYISTIGKQVRDDFFLSWKAGKLPQSVREELELKLLQLESAQL